MSMLFLKTRISRAAYQTWSRRGEGNRCGTPSSSFHSSLFQLSSLLQTRHFASGRGSFMIEALSLVPAAPQYQYCVSPSLLSCQARSFAREQTLRARRNHVNCIYSQFPLWPFSLCYDCEVLCGRIRLTCHWVSYAVTTTTMTEPLWLMY